jgi:threonine/homoserine/homoserine lactone efflux protein
MGSSRLRGGETSMTGIHDIALFVAAGLMLNVTPGPDMAYIAARSAAGGFRDGAAAVFGITAGCVVHTLAAAIGLSALLATSATAFEVVKWAGALYLFYAGIRLITAKKAGDHAQPREFASASAPEAIAAPQRARPSRIFREALLINVFNPKVALFFLAFLPQFIAFDAPDKALAFVLLGTVFNFNSLFVNLPVAWLASRAGHRWRGRADAIHWMRRIVGGLFVLLAVRLAALSRD